MEQQFPRELSAIAELLVFTEEFLARHQVGPRAGFAVKLTVEELFSNLIRHNAGGGDHVLLDLIRQQDRVLVHLTDFEVESFADPKPLPVDTHAALADRPSSGLGLFLVRSLAEDLKYDYADRVLRVAAIINLEEPVFHIHRGRNGDIVFAGKLEAGQAEKAREFLGQVQESCDLDLGDLDYISSPGLGVLIEAQRRLNESGHSLKIKNLDKYLRELFLIAGFDHIFEIE